ncbi:hypothetical protein M413DRAFT_448572 [Hebeloma cylindrosporum]|uniref:DUF6533 domain-containing protein n=1 Tax=Hebeloma cylindrosporum TaxID=76867 RepID=A0A0C2Y8C8_HEBCY|nr:hypothetical protein M413DRAFT_448572 [Hebeloma cylindrosporum h7]
MEFSSSSFRPSFAALMPAVRTDSSEFIPLYVVLSALVWVIYDYFITLEDEVKYFWSRKLSPGTLMFFWIRYYTVFLLVFDAIETHMHAIPEIMTQSLIVGAIILWSTEIIMQLRIYVLFNRSKWVAFVNGFLFMISVGIFLWIMIDNGLHHPPLPDFNSSDMPEKPPSCLNIKGGGNRWAHWLPATLFEFVLFGMAVYKTVISPPPGMRINGRRSLTAVLLHQNVLYFFTVACVLVLNNLMVVCGTHVPWFGFGPFHASLGVATGRMLIDLRKCASDIFDVETDSHFLPNWSHRISTVKTFR